jgi:hypothetical protein
VTVHERFGIVHLVCAAGKAAGACRHRTHAPGPHARAPRKGRACGAKARRHDPPAREFARPPVHALVLAGVRVTGGCGQLGDHARVRQTPGASERGRGHHGRASRGERGRRRTRDARSFDARSCSSSCFAVQAARLRRPAPQRRSTDRSFAPIFASAQKILKVDSDERALSRAQDVRKGQPALLRYQNRSAGLAKGSR